MVDQTVTREGTEPSAIVDRAYAYDSAGNLTGVTDRLDATRNRVRIRGYIDLPNDELKLRLRPRPKQRNLINLATPVKIRGPVADPKIRFSSGGIAVTAFRLSLWVYTVWVDLLRKPLPMDGSDVCLDPQPRHP